MRNSSTRVLTLVTTTPLLVAAAVAAAPAAHANHASTAPRCGAGATVIADFFTLGGNHTRIASDDVSATVKHVCIEILGLGESVVVVESGVALSPPSVTQTAGTGFCPTRVIDMTAPVAASLSVGASPSGPSICLGQDGKTTTVSFNAASVSTLPGVEVWAVHNTWANVAYCGPHKYALYAAGVDDGSDYWDCMVRDNQVL